MRPSWKAELRQAGTNALEEAERKLVLWDLSPLRILLCFHASMFLTSHALIGRSHALRGNISHAEETMRGRPSAGADTELGRPHVGATSAVGMFAQVQPAALNGPAGVRRSFWDALQSDPTPRGKAAEQPTSRGKGELVEPQYVFGAVARTTVTVISEPRGAIQATSLRDAANFRLNPSKNQKQKGKNQRAHS